jgi:HlyD family secretion protein
MKKKIIIGSVVVVLIALAFVFKACSSKEQKITAETVKVKKGSVSTIVTATGTINAIKSITVGTQVSGEIKKIYVDYNSQVKAGELLAELDLKPLTTALNIAGASLDDAKAENTYRDANYKRIKALFDKKLVSEADYDEAVYNFETAKAALNTAQLNYDKAKINLGYASIYSPIDGVVLSVAVEEGQTVAASYSTPTLFTIVKDLTKMQVEASIDEADIGQVKDGQRVEFTVDAYSEKRFEGKVTQIRLEPTTTSNVVTYTVIVEAPNPDKKLMPGMTASIKIYTEEANDVLTVSSKALHFTPDSATLVAYMKSNNMKPGTPPTEEQMDKKMEGPAPAAEADDAESHKMVWIKTQTDVHPVPITVGIDNDIDAQVISGLKEGDEVIISMTSPTNASGTAATSSGSPFMPKPPSGNKKK